MNLLGRDLKQGMRGDDIGLLHREMMLIGYTETLHPEERRDSVLGPGTFEAVSHFQNVRGMETTGIIDAQTAHAINAVVEAETITVEGRVASGTARTWHPPAHSDAAGL
jgi:peptidoglycan hydrolase-like protein with peptidoglycan-binding domain